MKTAEEIALSVHCGDGTIAREKRDSLARQIKSYASQCCEDLRQRCYENAEANIEYDYQYPFAEINKGSILNTEIILP